MAEDFTDADLDELEAAIQQLATQMKQGAARTNAQLERLANTMQQHALHISGYYDRCEMSLQTLQPDGAHGNSAKEGESSLAIDDSTPIHIVLSSSFEEVLTDDCMSFLTGNAKYPNKDEVESFPTLNELQFVPVCDTSWPALTPLPKVIQVPQIRTNQVWSITSTLDSSTICDLAFTMVYSSLHTFLSVMPCNCSLYCRTQFHGLNIHFPSLVGFYTYVFDPGTPKVTCSSSYHIFLINASTILLTATNMIPFLELDDCFSSLLASIGVGTLVLWPYALQHAVDMDVLSSYILIQQPHDVHCGGLCVDTLGTLFTYMPCLCEFPVEYLDFVVPTHSSKHFCFRPCFVLFQSFYALSTKPSMCLFFCLIRLQVSLVGFPLLFPFFIHVFDPGAVRGNWYLYCVDEIHINGGIYEASLHYHSLLNARWHDLFLKGWCEESKVIWKVSSQEATNDNLHEEFLYSRFLLVVKFLSLCHCIHTAHGVPRFELLMWYGIGTKRHTTYEVIGDLQQLFSKLVCGLLLKDYPETLSTNYDDFDCHILLQFQYKGDFEVAYICSSSIGFIFLANGALPEQFHVLLKLWAQLGIFRGIFLLYRQRESFYVDESRRCCLGVSMPKLSALMITAFSFYMGYSYIIVAIFFGILPFHADLTIIKAICLVVALGLYYHLDFLHLHPIVVWADKLQRTPPLYFPLIVMVQLSLTQTVVYPYMPFCFSWSFHISFSWNGVDPPTCTPQKASPTIHAKLDLEDKVVFDGVGNVTDPNSYSIDPTCARPNTGEQAQLHGKAGATRHGLRARRPSQRVRDLPNI